MLRSFHVIAWRNYVRNHEKQKFERRRARKATFKTMENRNLNVSEHEKNNANGENVHNHLRRKDYAFI